MLEDVGSKMVFFCLSWEMLWHLGAKMAHKSAKTRQDNHQMIIEVEFMLLLCVFDIGASKTSFFARVEFLKHYICGDKFSRPPTLLCVFYTPKHGLR